MVGELRVDDTRLLMVIEALKGDSPDQQEAAIQELEKEHPGIGDRARALLALELKEAAEIAKKVKNSGAKIGVAAKIEVEAEPKQGKWRKVGSAWFKNEGNGWRRHLGPLPKELPNSSVGVPQLKVVEQAKPEEAEPEKEEEPKKAAAAEEPKEASGRAVVPVLEPGGAEWNEAIAVMNKQHAIIENVGGKAVIASWEPATYDPDKLVIVFQNKESFLLRYSNRFIWLELFDGKGSRVRMGLGQWWLSHRDRQQYRGVLFKPGAPGVVNECLNLWRGWGVEAIPGDWGLIREHICEVLAGGNKAFGDYVLWWIAWAVQHPDRHAEAALVLIGLKGVGKGTLVRCLRRIFGAHAFQV
ncbi:MAG: hypothetical protein C5B60_02010, partial [Chloroflexi bacterium]